MTRFLEDNFKGKHVKNDSILNRLKNDNRLSEEVKCKLRKGMEGPESSDDDSGSEDDNENKETKQTRVKKEKSRIREKIEKLRSDRQRQKYKIKSKDDEDMQDEDEEALKEKENMKKLEILRIKESKLKRSISKELKASGKYDET